MDKRFAILHNCNLIYPKYFVEPHFDIIKQLISEFNKFNKNNKKLLNQLENEMRYKICSEKPQLYTDLYRSNRSELLKDLYCSYSSSLDNFTFVKHPDVLHLIINEPNKEEEKGEQQKEQQQEEQQQNEERKKKEMEINDIILNKFSLMYRGMLKVDREHMKLQRDLISQIELTLVGGSENNLNKFSNIESLKDKVKEHCSNSHCENGDLVCNAIEKQFTELKKSNVIVFFIYNKEVRMLYFETQYRNKDGQEKIELFTSRIEFLKFSIPNYSNEISFVFEDYKTTYLFLERSKKIFEEDLEKEFLDKVKNLTINNQETDQNLQKQQPKENKEEK